jgi:predicted nucleic acid-binding protein
MKTYLPDTNIFSLADRGGRRAADARAFLDGEAPRLRLSAIVALELEVGTRAAGRRGDPTVARFEAAGRIVAPSARVCREAALLLRDLRAAGYDPAVLQNDALIAMTARATGATVLTENAADFDLLRRIRPFDLEIL